MHDFGGSTGQVRTTKYEVRESRLVIVFIQSIYVRRRGSTNSGQSPQYCRAKVPRLPLVFDSFGSSQKNAQEEMSLNVVTICEPFNLLVVSTTN